MACLRGVVVSLWCVALGLPSCAGKSVREAGESDAPSNASCSLPADPGRCLAALPRYAYDAASKLCVPFTWGGCDGNANRFDSLSACRAACTEPSDIDHCASNDECTLAPASCCSCGANQTSQVIALRADAYAAFSGARCATVDCSCSQSQAISPYLVATCESGRCTPVDLHLTAATACTSSQDCQTRAGSQCCPLCNPSYSDWIAVSDGNALQALVCPSGGGACGLCASPPPPTLTSCVNGRCYIVPHL